MAATVEESTPPDMATAMVFCPVTYSLFGARSERCIEILDPGRAVNTMWRGMKSIQ
jgi:hypothetical protein